MLISQAGASSAAGTWLADRPKTSTKSKRLETNKKIVGHFQRRKKRIVGPSPLLAGALRSREDSGEGHELPIQVGKEENGK